MLFLYIHYHDSPWKSCGVKSLAKEKHLQRIWQLQMGLAIQRNGINDLPRYLYSMILFLEYWAYFYKKTLNVLRVYGSVQPFAIMVSYNLLSILPLNLNFRNPDFFLLNIFFSLAFQKYYPIKYSWDWFRKHKLESCSQNI